MPREERNQEQREATRRRIVEAALRRFARDGFAETPVRAIAREAGIAQGLLYHYFKSKEALLPAIYEECLAQVRESFAAGEAEGTPPSERLARLIRRSFEVLRANEDFWRLTYLLRFQPAVLDAVAPLMDNWVAAVLGTLQAHLAALGVPNAAVAARLLFAQIDGVSQHYALQPAHYPLDAVTEELVARWCPPHGKGPEI